MAMMIIYLEINYQKTNSSISSESGKTVLTIGALPPLTGNFRSKGEVANAGIEVSRRDFESMDPNLTIRLQIEDTASDPAIALSKFKSHAADLNQRSHWTAD